MEKRRRRRRGKSVIIELNAYIYLFNSSYNNIDETRRKYKYLEKQNYVFNSLFYFLIVVEAVIATTKFVQFISCEKGSACWGKLLFFDTRITFVYIDIEDNLS